MKTIKFNLGETVYFSSKGTYHTIEAVDNEFGIVKLTDSDECWDENEFETVEDLDTV